MPSPELALLLGRAASADPNARIGFRDQIAAFGVDAITAVQPWAMLPVLEDLARLYLTIVPDGGTH